MSQTRIFVSSTCYDLAHIRQALNQHISEMGHTPVMSEFSSFRVDPRANNLENCRRNVQRNADVFVLIIGGKRGSVDAQAQKSIVNLEYQAARAEGLDIIVFVDAAVMALLPVWKVNPQASFAPVVDSNEVLAFVHGIREEQRWTYTFTREADIYEVLKTQLSGQLRDLLELRRRGSLNYLELFAGESREAQRLVRDRGSFWEYALTAELLEKRLQQAQRESGLVKAGCVLGSHTTLKSHAYIAWVTDKFPELQATIATLVHAVNVDTMKSWGPPGVSGNPEEILAAADHVDRVLRALVSLEQEIYRTHGPESSEQLRNVMLGMTDEVVEAIAKAVSDLREQIEVGRSWREGDAPQSLNVTLTLTFSRGDAFVNAVGYMRNARERDDLG